MAPARSTITGSRRAGGGSIQVGGRVGARNDGLLQFSNRRRGVLGGSGQIEAGVRQVGAPLGFTAQVQGAAVGQLKAHSAGHAGVDLVACEQTVTFY